MNYLTNDTDLTQVADAIRAKGGTKDRLQFPDEFVSAIEDMDVTLSECIYMPKSTVIQLFDDLGTIDTAHTITLPYGMKNYLLTAEEIAVITEKGWTVA